MGKIRQELYTFCKAEFTASIASIVDFGLAYVLSDVVGLYYGLANALGVMSGGITNCCLNYKYVFGDSHRKKKSIAWRYFIIWGISWILNSGGTIALTEAINIHEHINVHFMIPKCFVSLLVAILVNYPGQRKFVFKQKKEDQRIGTQQEKNKDLENKDLKNIDPENKDSKVEDSNNKNN